MVHPHDKDFLRKCGFSGKTASMVREMVMNKSHRAYYTNIMPKKKKLTPQIKTINANMIIQKNIISHKKNGEPNYELKLNEEFWRKLHEPLNVVLDEAHMVLNPRRSMSKVNIIMTDWIAMIRRILGEADSGYGDLTLITQLPQRLDNIARDMATHIRYHIGHYKKSCTNCQLTWSESSEHPEPVWLCPRCGNFKIKKHSNMIECYHFSNMNMFLDWKMSGAKTEHRHYYITDIEDYFPYYDTLQWENLLSDLY